MPTNSAVNNATKPRGKTLGGDKVPALVIKRTFDAPRDIVWKVWSDPSQAKHWWGPNGSTLPFVEMDQRPSGKWRAQMRTPDGKDLWQHGVYREIVPPEKTVYTFIWDAEPENEMLVSVIFKAKGNKTEMTFTQDGFKSVEDREGHEGGWTQTFDRFAKHLAKTNGGVNAR